MTLQVCTASWSRLWAAEKAGRLDVLPVRISRGGPRFWPAAKSFPALPDLMPEGWMFGLSTDEFWPAYARKLDGIGVEPIGRQLDELAEAHDCRLALACFETDVMTCHRGPLGFAGWWARHTGVIVEEFQLEQISNVGDAGGPAQLALDVDDQHAPVRARDRGRYP